MIPIRGEKPKKKKNFRNYKYQPWQYQKILQKGDIPDYNDVIVIAKNITNPRTQALFVLLYLTAGRITEVVGTLRKKDIALKEIKDRQVMLIKMVNRKHKKRRFKYIPVPIDKEHILVEMIIRYLAPLYDNQILFDFQKSRAYKLIRKSTNMGCHWIRHLRLTHLVLDYDFNEHILTKFAGWTDARPSKHYIELRISDILDSY